MLYYYAIYERDIEDFPDQEPSGMIIMGVGQGESIMFSHRAKKWLRDPKTVGSWLAGERNEFRRKEVPRSEAEQMAIVVTKGTYRLPSEETIRKVFEKARERAGQS